MKKILIGLILSLFTISANADDHFEFWPATAPLICGTVEQINEFTEGKGFKPFAISYGRVGGKPEGEIAFIVTHWLSEESPAQSVTMSNPEGTESCILYTSFDTVFNPNFGKGLEL